MKLVFNKPNSAITRYDFIEEKVHIGKILEIGSNQIALMKSTLRKKIINSDYLNLDINPTFNNRICTIKEDIVSYKIREKYDTIIMLEVLEHLHLREWSIVISKLKKSLKKGGILIVSTPYKQSISNYVKIIESLNYYQIHTIFNIDKKLMKIFFGNKAEICVLNNIRFKNDGSSVVWAVLRFLKRLIFRRNSHNNFVKTIFVFFEKE